MIIEICEDCPYKIHPCPEGCSKTMEHITLKELEIGDRFVPQNGKYPIFEVVGKSTFNIRHGSPTRDVKNEKTNEVHSFSCRRRVIKLPMK